MSSIPTTLESLFKARLTWLQIHNYAPTTISFDSTVLKKFRTWCETRELSLPQEITSQTVLAYQRWLHRQKNRNGTRMAVSYQHQVLGSLQRCFRWAHQQGYLLADPTGTMELPKRPQRLPKVIYSVEEIEKILLQPKLKTPQGLRDRALLEVFYATAIRRNEALFLKPDDLDLQRGTLWIRQGKGGKDRVVPISTRAIEWIERYEVEARERFLSKNPNCEFLFLSMHGQRLSEGTVNQRVGDYIKKALPNKAGNCHAFRHSVATLLLENGCDVRYIQEFLGHSNLNTTQIYTRVGVSNLKEVYQRFHPSSQ